MIDLAIGSTVYVFDGNYREYDRNSPDWPGPIYRKHFRPMRIVDETSRSWVLEGHPGRKINKTTLDGIYVDLEAVERAVWVERNSYRIGGIIGRLRDYDKLRAIAEIIGYEASP